MSNKKVLVNPQVDNPVTKVIKNYSLQGLSVLLNTENGPKFIWLAPRQAVTVSEAYISVQAQNLHKRRLIQISN